MIPERDDIIYDINQFSPSKHSFIHLFGKNSIEENIYF